MLDAPISIVEEELRKMCNVLDGWAVPMPMRPEESIVMRTTLFVMK